MSTASHFAEFLSGIGHQVVPVANLYAYNKHPLAWLAFPFHQSMQRNDDLEALVRAQQRMWLLRYCEPLTGTGIDSHRIVCTDKHYELDALSANTRSKTRRGLKNCTVEQVSPADLKHIGFELFHATRTRQNRPLDKKAYDRWVRYCETANGVNGFCSWGAWVGNDLAALMIGFQMDDCFNLLRHASNSQLLRHYPNNALIYQITRQMIKREDINEISYGLAPLATDVNSLDSFKQNMGYRLQPIKQNVLITPQLRPVAPILSTTLHALSAMARNNGAMAEARAMLQVGVR